MYIDLFKNNGTEYIRLRESYRTKTADGKVAIRKRTLCNIGPLSKFDDGKPDYLPSLPLSPIKKPQKSFKTDVKLVIFY